MRLLRLVLPLLLLLGLTSTLCARTPAPMPAGEKKVAAVLASWFKYSHPDVLLGRLIKTYSVDGKGEVSRLKLVSVYRDKPSAPDKELSDTCADEYQFKISNSVEEALTLGTGTLAVDAVFLCTEWADYPVSPTGATMYPHRRLFADVVKVFEASHRVVPVFIDKHIADNWAECNWIYETAKKMMIPLMAGSSVPVSWRRPAVDVKRGARLKEIVGISYHTLDGYAFHGMEMVQCLAERRKGGETGIKSVQCLSDQAVWDAAGKLYDPALLLAALARLSTPVPDMDQVKIRVQHPVLFVMDYYDGLRVNLFTLNGVVGEWAAAWRYQDGLLESTLFWLDDSPRMMHFANLMHGIEQMYLTGKPSWPAERTLLTSGALDALLISRKDGGIPVKTPYLRIKYSCRNWAWSQPADPPQGAL